MWNCRASYYWYFQLFNWPLFRLPHYSWLCLVHKKESLWIIASGVGFSWPYPAISVKALKAYLNHWTQSGKITYWTSVFLWSDIYLLKLWGKGWCQTLYIGSSINTNYLYILPFMCHYWPQFILFCESAFIADWLDQSEMGGIWQIRLKKYSMAIL